MPNSILPNGKVRLVTVLGLDIGGANLKAATNTKLAASVPFALWKNPDGLADALRELCAQFSGWDSLAVTMTGELCDAFQTKREGVAHILKHVRAVCQSHPVHVWSTSGKFVTIDEANASPLNVASANWHALATYAGSYITRGTGLLLDIGSTTTDLIPILDGLPDTRGKTDPTRLQNSELLYTGVKRTPIMAILPAGSVAAEYFATMQDAYLLTGQMPEDPTDTDTADGRPATKANAHARMSRMVCGDPDITSLQETERLAAQACTIQLGMVETHLHHAEGMMKSLAREALDPDRRVLITSGSGEFLALQACESTRLDWSETISLTDKLGPALAAAAPAYSVAVLLAERR
jgi:(4-(4-[2-(gamma-L-glutamylamino)ethyl]phenoxymethyl)furan-2-yl)methanamine synthase